MLTFVDDLEIVEVIDGFLYSVKWPNQEFHSLDEMAVRLSDAEYLISFYRRHQERLGFFRVSEIEAVVRTQRESNEILQEILELATNAKRGGEPDLDSLFIPLHQNQAYQHPGFYTDFKAKGHRLQAPWLRIYAVKCDDNFYCITGYGIKLVKQMQDDPLLIDELKKLKLATTYLKAEGYL